MLAVFAIVNGNEAGWGSARTLGLLGGAVVMLIAFLVIESRVTSPLVPLGLFRIRNVASANVVGVLMAGGLFAWFFFSALYLQQILGFTPARGGARLPALDDHLGRLLADLRPARDALRHHGAAGRRARADGRRPAAVRPHAGQREPGPGRASRARS